MAKNKDISEYLPEFILLTIISFLPFKEAARTSILSKKWRNIWRGSKNVEFNESFFVRNGDPVQRRLFINFARQWILNYPGSQAIDQFRLTFSRPMNFAAEMEEFISFATHHRVNVLSIDFSDRSWNEPDPHHVAALFDLPLQVYQLNTLQSLQLFSCNFQVSQFNNFCRLKCLSLGWVDLVHSSVRDLLSSCPLLESLSLKNCFNLIASDISGLQLRTLVLDKCSFHGEFIQNIQITAPKLQFLKYSGSMSQFNFEGPHRMHEADLDFSSELFWVNQYSDLLSSLLREICCIRILTVCSYLLQIISLGEESLGLSPPLDVKHLTLKTAMHENEFFGISFMLKSCPLLEKLFIEIGLEHIIENYEPPFAFVRGHFWEQNVIVFDCIKYTLKEVEFRNFEGTKNEFNVLGYLTRYGRVMEKLTLNLYKGGNEESYMEIAQKLNKCRMVSKRCRVVIQLGDTILTEVPPREKLI